MSFRLYYFEVERVKRRIDNTKPYTTLNLTLILFFCGIYPELGKIKLLLLFQYQN